MKIKVFGLMALLLALSACSSSSSGGGGGGGGGTNAEQNQGFEKLAVGQWLSECQHSQEEPNYRELVTLGKSGKGQSQIMSFQSTDCSGNSGIAGDNVSFDYTVKSSDGKNSTLSVIPNGQTAFEIVLAIHDDKMIITWPTQPGSQPQQTVYYRISPPTSEEGGVVKPTDPQTNDAKNFDLFATGHWVGKSCTTHQNSESSYQTNVIFYGQGIGKFEFFSFANRNCSGQAQKSTQHFEYRVDHFANKAGQITVNGEIMDVMFDAAQMTVFTANGNAVFQKAD